MFFIGNITSRLNKIILKRLPKHDNLIGEANAILLTLMSHSNDFISTNAHHQPEKKNEDDSHEALSRVGALQVKRTETGRL